MTDPRCFNLLGFSVCDPLVVAIVVEDGLACISAVDDVIDRSRELNSRKSMHSASLVGAEPTSEETAYPS